MKSERALVLLRADTAGLPDTEAQEMTRNRRSLASPPEIEVNSPLVSLLTRGVRALLVFSLSLSLFAPIYVRPDVRKHTARALFRGDFSTTVAIARIDRAAHFALHRQRKIAVQGEKRWKTTENNFALPWQKPGGGLAPFSATPHKSDFFEQSSPPASNFNRFGRFF